MKIKHIAFLATSLLLASLSTYAADKDHDGINDAHDQCPNTHQLKKLPSDFVYSAAVNPERLKPGNQSYPVNSNGCEPDNDNDGVVNSQDYCPNDSQRAISKGISSNGCPKHSDADGTPDYRDLCPNTPRRVKTNRDGCEIVS